MKNKFNLGDKVLVSHEGGWQKNSLGFICGDPELVETNQGNNYFYWVEFYEPQNDLSNTGPYRKAQILSQYLSRA